MRRGMGIVLSDLGAFTIFSMSATENFALPSVSTAPSRFQCSLTLLVKLLGRPAPFLLWPSPNRSPLVLPCAYTESHRTLPALLWSCHRAAPCGEATA